MTRRLIVSFTDDPTSVELVDATPPHLTRVDFNRVSQKRITDLTNELVEIFGPDVALQLIGTRAVINGIKPSDEALQRLCHLLLHLNEEGELFGIKLTFEFEVPEASTK